MTSGLPEAPRTRAGSIAVIRTARLGLSARTATNERHLGAPCNTACHPRGNCLSFSVFVIQKLVAISYDDLKRQMNLDAHGFDFAEFAERFDATHAVFVETKPSRTGIQRFRVIGRWSDGRIVTAILSPLGSEAWSLVSLRTASKLERRTYVHYQKAD